MAHGLQVPNALLSPVHIAISPKESRRKKPGFVTCHVDHGGARTHADGLPCTGIAQTLLDCLCESSFRHGLAIVDSALHNRLITAEDLQAYFKRHGKGRRGIRQARETLAHADGRSENGGESIVRAIIIELGFKAPELQVEIEDPLHPGVCRRADFGWLTEDGQPILGELDGLSKYLTRSPRDEGAATSAVKDAIQAMRAERTREAHLNLTGAKVVRFSFAEALDTDYFFNLLATAGVPFQND